MGYMADLNALSSSPRMRNSTPSSASLSVPLPLALSTGVDPLRELLLHLGFALPHLPRLVGYIRAFVV